MLEDEFPDDDLYGAEDEDLSEADDDAENLEDDEDWDDEDEDDDDLLDEDEATEALVQELQEKGDVVFSHNWEGGAGEYATYVYKMDGGYYAYDMFEETVDGPYPSLRDALPDEALTVTSATTAIECKELDFDALAALLTMDDTTDEPVWVNGRNWPPEA